MELDTTIKKRKSVRSFKSKKPSWKDVLAAIDAAIQAPSAGGHFNLKFLMVEKPETIKSLAALCEQSWVSESKFLIVVTSDDRNIENLHGERGRIYSRQQAGASIENILLKLTDLGLSGCWIGSYTDERVRQLLKIPSHILVEAIIPVGYEKPSRSPKKRKRSIESCIFWETWETYNRPTKFTEPPTVSD
jgi:nitroreductase